MKYQIIKTQRAVFFTECPIDNPNISQNTGFRIYYTFSEAFDEFKKTVQRYSRVYYYSSTIGDILTIEATPEGDLDLCQGMIGPYDDALIAYGVQHVKKRIKHCGFDEQFSTGARVIFDCHVNCNDHDYCIMRTTGSVEMVVNVSPTNDFSGIESGTQLFLRIWSQNDEIFVYNSPEQLQNDIHLPPKILIPIGTYHNDPRSRDSSAVFTGCVTRATVLSQQGRLRYQLTVQTLAMDIDVDVLTDSEIHVGDFIYIRTHLSARS